MYKTFFLISFLLATAIIQAQVTQEWANLYFNSTKNVQGKVIALDSTGNVIVAGQGGNISWLVVKYNSAGTKLWEKRFYVASEFPQHIAVDRTGSIYLAGTDWACMLLKISSVGDSLWVRHYPLSGGYGGYTGIVVTPDNCPVVTGVDRASTRDDIVTVKYNPNGDTLWARRYNSIYNRDDSPASISLGRDGSILIAGYSYDPNWHCQFLTLKYDSTGTLKWVQRYGTSDSVSTILDGAFDGNGNAYVVGNLNLTSYCTIKYDSNGNLKWARVYSDTHSDAYPYSLKIDNRNNVIVSGTSMLNNYALYVTTIKYDSLGNRQWIKYLNNFNDSSTYINNNYSLAVDSYNNTYITGLYEIRNTPVRQTGLFAIKYTNEGVYSWGMTYYRGIDLDGGSGIKVDNNSNVYVIDNTQDSVLGYGMVTIKYSQTTGITIAGNGLPNNCILHQNYPNPFNPVTKISYALPKDAKVSLVVYDILGREITKLVNAEFKKAGSYTIEFNASIYASGVYFYRIQAGDFVQTKKMLMIK
ncbi:MAG: T9SS type A sorting domain-containing protein [Ignavibacteria bacterium]|nr:T9SS type A sorting domain-containing protein [Ignavibacteria bacterium]